MRCLLCTQWLIAVAVPMALAAPAAGQLVVPLSQMRLVRGEASAEQPGGPPLVLQEEHAAANFSTFQRSVNLNAAGPGPGLATALQTSGISSNFVFGSGGAMGAGMHGTGGLMGDGLGRSYYAMTFTITQARSTRLTGTLWASGTGVALSRLRLEMVGGGAPLAEYACDPAAAMVSIDQVLPLEPGQYTLTAEALGEGWGGATLGTQFAGQANFQFSLAVPGPGVGAVVGVVGLVGLMAGRRRRGGES